MECEGSQWGWLCPDCGSETPFSKRRCRARGRAVRAQFRAQERACACAEQLLHAGLRLLSYELERAKALAASRMDKFFAGAADRWRLKSIAATVEKALEALKTAAD